jgi:Tfp pilus assembly protein PilF
VGSRFKGRTAQARSHRSRRLVFTGCLGLLQLRNGEAAKALDSFDREVSDAGISIYFREYRVNARVAAGYAHLAANDPPAASDAFRRALEVMPSNGRALLGLQQASVRGGQTADAASLASRGDESIMELTKAGRGAEAAMLSASVEVARGDVRSASEILERLLGAAPPGQFGWMIPIDPALAPLRGHASFQPVLALLSARAS